MADPAGMVCTSGENKGRKIDICVDQAEYTNGWRDQVAAANAGTIQVVSVDGEGKQLQIVGSESDIDGAWRKFAQTPPALGRGVAGYVLKPVSGKVFP